MKKIILLILFVIGISISGCLYNKPLPKMPNYSTWGGKQNAQNCQRYYNECISACSGMIGGAVTARQRRDCMNDCRKILEDCYNSCE